MALRDLFPRPRAIEHLGGATSIEAPLCERATKALGAECYRLTVRTGSVELAFSDESGRRYGRQALAQLRGGGGTQIPDCRIDDGPGLAVRGYMLDVSRDRVPTRECLGWLVDRLAAYRFNHLQLYTEHTFAYRDHERAWAGASPITPDDVHWLDALCAEHGIELAANQNTFGHMERWLRHEPYRRRAECPDGFEQGARRRGPTALAPTPANAEFALELVRELLPHFTSRRINIGCDEVWELGQGVSARAVAERSKGAVFVEHLRRIAEPLQADGCDVQFWADMLQQAPEAAAPLAASGAIAAIWGYEQPSGIDLSTIDFDALPDSLREVARDYLSITAEGFGPRLAAFAKTGFRTWVVPGTSGWNSFGGRHANARGNILDAVESGLAHGVEGILLTEWGDNGHLQPPFATLPALAYAGATAWCRASNGDCDDAALARAVSASVFDATGRFGSALIELGGIADTLGLQQPNGTAYFYALIDSGLPLEPGSPAAAAHAAALGQLEAADEKLRRAAPQVADGALLVGESRQAAALTRLGLDTLAARSGLAAMSEADLARARAALVEPQRACWLARSRTGGLDDSLRRLRAAAQVGT